MPVTQAYFDLIDAFAEPGCAVCRMALADVHRFLDALLYEYVVDYDIYDAFRKSRGLCNFHTGQLAHFTGNAPGITVLYHGAIEEILKLLDKTPAKSPVSLRRMLGRDSGENVQADRLEPEGECPACAKLHDAEGRYLTILHDHPADEKILTAYRASDGLCLPHFRGLLRLAPVPEHLALLIEHQKQIWSRLKEELAAFIAKDGTQSAEAGAEGDSRFRAMLALTGERGILRKMD
jgi:hypothetical protein